MSESQTALIINLKFANINLTRVRKGSRMEKLGHFPWTEELFVFYLSSSEDTFRAIGKLVVLKYFKNEG